MSQMLHIRKNLLKKTQTEMAAIAQVSQATVSRWEAGVMEPSRIEMLRIREAAKKVGKWSDSLFFDPAEKPDPAPTPTEAAA